MNDMERLYGLYITDEADFKEKKPEIHDKILKHRQSFGDEVVWEFLECAQVRPYDGKTLPIEVSYLHKHNEDRSLYYEVDPATNEILEWSDEID